MYPYKLRVFFGGRIDCKIQHFCKKRNPFVKVFSHRRTNFTVLLKDLSKSGGFLFRVENWCNVCELSAS
jgi:hypothetical protein